MLTEVLRMYPVLPFLDRLCMENYRIPGSDVVIEKGTNVYIPMCGLHYDPDYFPDPKKFNPDRFAPDSDQDRPSGCYVPFGAGPRLCVGK